MPKYPIEVYRREFPSIEFRLDEDGSGDILYRDNEGTFQFCVQDGSESHGGYYPRIDADIAEKFRKMHNGSYIPKPFVAKPVGIMAVVAQAEKETALRKQIESLQEELEAIEADETNAPTLYQVETFGYGAFEPEKFAFVTTSEEEAELWYNLRGQVRSGMAWGHGFIPTSQYVNGKEYGGRLTGRVYELDFEDEGYAEALTAYVARLRA